MEKYCTTSDVKCTAGANLSPQSAGLTSNALPEVQKSIKPTNLQTGVSTNNVQSRTSVDTNKATKDKPHCMLSAPRMAEKRKHTTIF